MRTLASRTGLCALVVWAALALAGAAQARGTPDSLPAVAATELPREAREVLALIEKGGPFPHERALKLTEHFGHNFDALADVLEDRDWLGKKGVVVTLLHAQAYRTGHPTEWHTLEELFAEACEYWRERQVPFWVFLA